MKLEVGNILKVHDGNGIGTIQIPISILNDSGIEIKSLVLNRSVNFSMYDQDAESIFKQTPEKTMMDLVKTVREELAADLSELGYDAMQKAKLDLFPDEKFRLALGSKLNSEILPIIPEEVTEVEPVQGLMSRVISRVAGIFRG